MDEQQKNLQAENGNTALPEPKKCDDGGRSSTAEEPTKNATNKGTSRERDADPDETNEMKNDDTYFGACPVCHGTDGYLNIGANHWFMCKQHKTKWCIGANLFSSAMDETPEQQAQEQESSGFDSFEVVEPFYPPPQPTKEGSADELLTGGTMNAKQFKRCLDDLLRSFGGYEREEGLPPAPDGRHHLDLGHENFVALLTSLRWSMQNIADFDGTEEPNNESSSASKFENDSHKAGEESRKRA
jgi:hypothetical protein